MAINLVSGLAGIICLPLMGAAVAGFPGKLPDCACLAAS
jgi:hypothetical protein